MSDRLFIYGTLLFDDVWSHIVGHAAVKQPAKAVDWARYYMQGKVYPGLKYEQGSTVEGALMQSLSDSDWCKLDEFEDSFYSRKLITVCDRNNAQVNAYCYVIEEEHYPCLTQTPWFPEKFEECQLQQFLLKLKERY